MAVFIEVGEPIGPYLIYIESIHEGIMTAGNNESESQVNAFKKAAREIGADQSEASFDKALGQIARANVPRKPATPKRKAAPSKAKKGLKVKVGKDWNG